MQNNLSIILIAHNEEKTIAQIIDGLFKNYKDEILEVIVVDDASTDHTASLVEARKKEYSALRLIKRIPPCGVGRALKTGFSHIHPCCEYVLTMDSDFVENIGQVRLLIDCLEKEGCDGVIGSRFIKGSRLINYPQNKKFMNRLFHVIVKALFAIKQNDLTNNFKLYKASIVRSLPWKSDDFAMNAETGMLPIMAGYRVKEVPVSWVGRNSQMGQSKFCLCKFGFSYIKVIFYVWRFSRRR